MNIQQLATSVYYLGIQEGTPDVTSKVKHKLLHPTVRIMEIEAQSLADFFGFWRQYIPPLGTLR